MEAADEVRWALARHGLSASAALVEQLLALPGREPEGWESWRPHSWLALRDALAGWDVTTEFGTEIGGADYLGPEGVAFAGNAAEHMLCLLVREDHPGQLASAVFEWDQTLGRFERRAESPAELE